MVPGQRRWITSCRTAVFLLACTGSMHCFSMDAGSATTSIDAMTGVAFGEVHGHLSLVDVTTALHPRFALGAGVAYFEAERGYHEWQGRLLATANVPLGRWLLEDRNLFYFSSESVQRYRNRLRMTLPAVLGYRALNAHAFDELYFDFDRGRFIRNNLALGMSVNIGSAGKIELYRVWMGNRGAPDANYMLASISWRFRP